MVEVSNNSSFCVLSGRRYLVARIILDNIKIEKLRSAIFMYVVCADIRLTLISLTLTSKIIS